MKPYAFAYTRARSIDEVIGLLTSEEDPRILAGGQSLVPILNMRMASPSRVIDINGLSELAGIREDGETVFIGALTRHAQVHASAVVRSKLPLMAEAIQYVAHPAVRNRGTFGGSLCLADPAAEMPAVCVALDAKLHVQGPEGLRIIPARDFFQDVYETALAPDEILLGAELPVASRDERFAFAELSRRHGDFAIAGLCCRGRMADGLISELDLCYFGASPKPTLALSASQCLTGTGASSEDVARAVAALGDDLSPQDDLQADGDMRLHLSGVLLKRLMPRIIDSGCHA